MREPKCLERSLRTSHGGFLLHSLEDPVDLFKYVCGHQRASATIPDSLLWYTFLIYVLGVYIEGVKCIRSKAI